LRKASIDAAISVVVLVLLFVLFLAVPRSALWLPDVASRFGATCELIVAGLAIAIPVGWLLSFLPIWPLLLVLRSIPFFFLALALSFPAALAGYFEGPHSDFVRLIWPAAVLAIFALPNVAAFDFKRSRADLFVSGLQCIVSRLPQLIAADFLVEIFFAWPGEGRAFIQSSFIGTGGSLGESVGIVLIASVLVIALRWLIASFAVRISAKSVL
jgi:hypothetical protein